MRVLVICETKDFQNFTRRFTIDAFARLNKPTLALCHTHIRNLRQVNLHSEHVAVKCFFGLVPFARKKGLLRKGERLLCTRWSKLFHAQDVVVLSSPDQNYFLDYVSPQTKLVYLISDPYVLMGYEWEKEAEILQRAHLVLTTSQQLRDAYLKKYHPQQKNVPAVYWPNCVDTTLWKADALPQPEKGEGKPVLGFAGNFMKIVDLTLLEKVVQQFTGCAIIIAGKIANSDPAYVQRLKAVLDQPNVVYKGFIPFNDLPREVATWDVCLMLDEQSELSSYHHHNKLYQYLALGKPVVAYRNHHDYDAMENVVYLSDTYDAYLDQVGKAISVSNNAALRQQRIAVAKENSADVRAVQLLNEIEKIYAV